VKLIRAPDDLVDKLRDISRSRGKSLCDYVTQILEQAVAPPLVKKVETELAEKGVEEELRVEAPQRVGEKETEEAISCLFKSLQERIEEFDSLRKREADESVIKMLSSKEAEVYKLAVSRRDAEEIGLRLLMDLVEVQGILKSLIDRHYLSDIPLKYSYQ